MRTSREYFARSCSAVLMIVLAFGPVMIPRLSSFGSQREQAAPSTVIRRPQYESARPPRIVAHPKAKAKTIIAAAPVSHAGDVFKGLGAWVDLYDHRLDPVRTVALMRANGVQTLYIQTGRTDTAYLVDPWVWNWVRAAHHAKMKVVGWYLPYYRSLSRDYGRVVAIPRQGPGGLRFDGLGIDIEYRGKVPQHQWMQRVAELEALVRRNVGPAFPVGAIVPPPLQMSVAPTYWSGFPWASLAKHADAFLLMSYWSDRAGCPQVARFCAYQFTWNNVAITRKLSARKGMLVHIIGGVGGVTTTDQVRSFVRGARDSHADGASFYDVNTTSAFVWPVLKLLSGLGHTS